TRGFAQELLDFLSRAAERGLDGDALVRLGRERGRPDWEAAGRFFNRYHDRFDVDPVPTIDYPELIRTAAGLLRDEAARRRERDAYDAVLVAVPAPGRPPGPGRGAAGVPPLRGGAARGLPARGGAAARRARPHGGARR